MFVYKHAFKTVHEWLGFHRVVTGQIKTRAADFSNFLWRLLRMGYPAFCLQYLFAIIKKISPNFLNSGVARLD